MSNVTVHTNWDTDHAEIEAAFEQANWPVQEVLPRLSGSWVTVVLEDGEHMDIFDGQKIAVLEDA